MTHKAQKDAAEWFSSVYPGGKILIIGGEPVPYILYVSHNMEIEAKAAGLNVLERQDNMQDDAAGSQKIVESLLTKYPDVQAVWCFNDRSALGASAALRAAGKKIYNAASPEAGRRDGDRHERHAGSDRSGPGRESSRPPTAAILNSWARPRSRSSTGSRRARCPETRSPTVIVCPYHRIDGTNVATGRHAAAESRSS